MRWPTDTQCRKESIQLLEIADILASQDQMMSFLLCLDLEQTKRMLLSPKLVNEEKLKAYR